MILFFSFAKQARVKPTFVFKAKEKRTHEGFLSFPLCSVKKDNKPPFFVDAFELVKSMVCLMSIIEALMVEVKRHLGSLSLFVSSLGIRATFYSSLSRDGLGLEECEVSTKVAPLGKGCNPLGMFLVNDTLVEFEEVEESTNEALEGDTTREEGADLGSILREEVCLEDWSSSNSATFSN